MLTFDNFKNLFHRAKKTQWILYKGNGKGQQIGSMLSDDEISIDDSLSELQDIVSSYGDGIYTVECRNSRTASRGNDIHTFMYGDGGESPKSVGKAGVVQPHPAQSFFQGLDARYFLEQSNVLQGQVTKLQMDILKKEMEILNLRRDIKDAEKTDDASIGSFLSKNPKIVDKMLDVLVPAPDNRTAAVGTLKTDQPIPAKVNAAAADDDEEDFEYEPGKIDLNGLFEVAMRIQAALPDMHPNEIMDKLADYVEENTDKARTLLQMLG